MSSFASACEACVKLADLGPAAGEESLPFGGFGQRDVVPECLLDPGAELREIQMPPCLQFAVEFVAKPGGCQIGNAPRGRRTKKPAQRGLS